MIYCVEDDDSIRNLMLYTLKAHGFEVKGFSNSTEFWSAIEIVKPELVLLDIMLPGEDGMSVLQKLRSNVETRDVMIIMASAKSAEYDIVSALDYGADDYLAKPFGMVEMVSRVKAVLRRTSNDKTTFYKCGKIEVCVEKHRVMANGKEVILTLKEYDMLCLFLKNPGVVFTRESILQQVWNTPIIGETRTVDVHVGTLRTKLGDAGRQIKTIRGVGYRINEE